MLNVPALAQPAFIGFDTIFQGVYLKTKTYWDRIATLKESTTEEERHLWMALIPELREWLGARQILNLSAREQTLRNKKFERTFGVDRTKLEDDQWNVFGPAVSELARVASLWPDKQVVDALKAGDTASAIVYDNQQFFDTDHPQDMDNPNSPVMRNLFLDLDLTDDNLQLVRAEMMAYKTEGGVPMEIVPNLLVVPPQLELTARRILKGSTIAKAVDSVGASPGGAAAPANLLEGVMDLLVLPRLADRPLEWYCMDTTRSVKPLIWQQRIAPEFAYQNKPEDPTVFETDQYTFGVRARGAGGYGPWFLAAKAIRPS